MTVTVEDLVVATRTLPGGVLEFEHAPVGSPTRAGTPRLRAHRAYYYTPTDGDRRRMVSVTTLLDSICPKPGLPPWAEAKGIAGAVRAVQLGEITAATDPLEAVERVRGLRLGADAARDEAAERGLDMHALLEAYMRTGDPPSINDFPVEQHGYVQAAARWLLTAQPEPQQIEELVCEPASGFAGRSDLVAVIEGFRTRVDFKTSERAAIWSSSHLQVGLYERAALACGDAPADRQVIVVLAADGSYRSMLSMATPELVDAALAFYRAVKPVDAACDAQNRAEKKARS